MVQIPKSIRIIINQQWLIWIFKDPIQHHLHSIVVILIHVIRSSSGISSSILMFRSVHSSNVLISKRYSNVEFHSIHNRTFFFLFFFDNLNCWSVNNEFFNLFFIFSLLFFSSLCSSIYKTIFLFHFFIRQCMSAGPMCPAFLSDDFLFQIHSMFIFLCWVCSRISAAVLFLTKIFP